jgi:hypothetical protein
MPFDSQGIATINGQRPVNGQDTDAAQITVPLDDIQSMLSQVLLKSGVAPMTGPLDMNGFKINNLAQASNPTDPVTLDQVQALLANVRSVPVGALAPLRSKTAPTGWLIEDGKTIGSASSGATGRANADTQDLFVHLWTQFTNTELPIQDSTGAASTRGGSAASDFAANKRMPLFDSRTRFLRGSDSGLNFDATLTVGLSQADAIKNHKHGFTTDPGGAHTPTIPRGGTGGGTGAQHGPPDGQQLSANPVPAHTHAGTTNDNTDGSALETRGRSSVVLYCIKL